MSEKIKFGRKQADEMRKYLGSYRYIVKNIKAMTDHMNEFCEDMYNPLHARVIGSAPTTRSTVYDQSFHTLEKIERIYSDMIRRMENEIEKMQAKKNEIEYLIENSGLDEDEKCVCRQRFIVGCLWVNMPEAVGYEQSQCQRKERSALKKIYAKLKDDQQ